MRKTTTHASRLALLALAPALVLAVRAPLAAAAPDSAMWGESSGYNTIEANRVSMSSLVIASAPDAAEADAMYSIEASRVMAAEAALASGDIGGMQEEALTNLVASASAAAAPTERITQFGHVR